MKQRRAWPASLDRFVATPLPAYAAPASPGETLETEFLTPFGLTATGVAAQLGLTPTSARALVRGTRRVDARLALRLAALCGTTAEFWLDLQRNRDLFEALNDPALVRLSAAVELGAARRGAVKAHARVRASAPAPAGR